MAQLWYMWILLIIKNKWAISYSAPVYTPKGIAYSRENKIHQNLTEKNEKSMLNND